VKQLTLTGYAPGLFIAFESVSVSASLR